MEVVVVAFILIVIAAVVLPQIQSPRVTTHRSTCRNNMRGLAMALFNHQVLHGAYPGYMNALSLQNGKVYREHYSTFVTPVSWAVMILPEIDRAPLFDQWRVDTETLPVRDFIKPQIYIEQFLCPSNPRPSKDGTPIGYVVNTGMPDARSAVFDEDPTKSMPRDWAANGMFFDNFTEHPLVKPDPAKRGPMVVMKDEMVRDRKDRTILLTENVDATKYTFDSESHSDDDWQAVEMQTGCIWRPGTFEAKGAEKSKPPQMKPPVASLHSNVETGNGDGKSYDHCRPSSRHPQSVNVAFVEQNVQSLSDTISYFVYAKLMSSDDAGVAPAGRPRDETTINAFDPHRYLREYELTEGDFNP